MVSVVGRYVTVRVLRLRVKSTVLELVGVILFLPLSQVLELRKAVGHRWNGLL